MNENHRDWHRFAAACQEHGIDPKQAVETLTVLTAIVQVFSGWGRSVLSRLQERHQADGD